MKQYTNTFYTYGALALIVLLAMVCMGYIYRGYSSIGTDGVFYAEMGKSIVLGDGLSVYGVPHTIFSPLLPLLIAPFYAMGFPLDASAHFPSMVFALMTIVGVYMIGRAAHSVAAGVLSALLIATSGIFLWNASVSTSPQIIAGYFTLLAFLCLINMKRGEIKSIILNTALAGIFICFAYLARPEYFLLMVPVLCWIGAVLFRARGFRVAITGVIVSLIVFLVVAFPYLLYLHIELGYWTISGRGTELALIVTSENMETVDESSGTGLATVVAPPKLENGAIGTALQEFPMLMKHLADGLVNTEHTFLRLFGFVGVFFLALGLRFLFLLKKFSILTLIAVFMSPVIFVAFAQGGSPNYLVQYFYLLIPIVAIGILETVNECSKHFSWGRRKKVAALVFLVALTSLYFIFPVMQNILFLPKDYRDVEYKQLGLWMNKNIPNIERETVVSRKPEPTFYANSLWSVIPNAQTVEELSLTMRERGQQYVVADDRTLPATRPELRDMLDAKKVEQYFTLVHEESYYGKRAFLYELAQ